jgi:hypothetical protein
VCATITVYLRRALFLCYRQPQGHLVYRENIQQFQVDKKTRSLIYIDLLNNFLTTTAMV